MEQFLTITFSFPTVIFTGLTIVAVLYWLLVALGGAEAEVLDTAFLPDADSVIGAENTVFDVAGLVSKLGLGGIPLTVIVTIWSIASYVCAFVISNINPLSGLWSALDVVMGAVVFFAALFAGFFSAVFILRPIRKMIIKLFPDDTPKGITPGMLAVVKSLELNDQGGWGIINDGAAGINKKMITTGPALKKGDEVILIEHLVNRDVWKVVSKAEFEGDALPPLK